MTEPGWYRAQGDLPGVERYWNGTEWIGETRQGAVPAFEPPTPSFPPPPGPLPFYAPPVDPAKQAAKRAFSDLLRVAAIVLSVLKAIPWVFALFFALLFADLANDFGDGTIDGWDLDGAFDGLFTAALGLLGVLVVAGALLVFQFVGAIMRKPLMVFVPALVMAIFDSFIAVACVVSVSSINNGFDTDPFGACYLIIAVAAAQVMVVVLSLRAHLRKPDVGSLEPAVT